MPTTANLELTERDRALLEFEALWSSRSASKNSASKHSASKQEAIGETFGLSSARYYQLLNAVIDSPAAVRHDPMLVGRLQRARDSRAQARAQRSFTS